MTNRFYIRYAFPAAESSLKNLTAMIESLNIAKHANFQAGANVYLQPCEALLKEYAALKAEYNKMARASKSIFGGDQTDQYEILVGKVENFLNRVNETKLSVIKYLKDFLVGYRKAFQPFLQQLDMLRNESLVLGEPSDSKKLNAAIQFSMKKMRHGDINFNDDLRPYLQIKANRIDRAITLLLEAMPVEMNIEQGLHFSCSQINKKEDGDRLLSELNSNDQNINEKIIHAINSCRLVEIGQDKYVELCSHINAAVSPDREEDIQAAINKEVGRQYPAGTPGGMTKADINYVRRQSVKYFKAPLQYSEKKVDKVAKKTPTL